MFVCPSVWVVEWFVRFTGRCELVVGDEVVVRIIHIFKPFVMPVKFVRVWVGDYGRSYMARKRCAGPEVVVMYDLGNLVCW